MKCFDPRQIRQRNIKVIRGSGLKMIKEDNSIPRESTSDIDRKVDILQDKLRQQTLQPIKNKLKAIKIAF